MRTFSGFLVGMVLRRGDQFRERGERPERREQALSFGRFSGAGDRHRDHSTGWGLSRWEQIKPVVLLVALGAECETTGIHYPPILFREAATSGWGWLSGGRLIRRTEIGSQPY
jgi:hypothetical protein